MPITSVSDISQNLLLRRDNATVRNQILTASRELATGKRANPTLHTKGYLQALSAIEASMIKSKSYLQNISEQKIKHTAVQAALSSIRGNANELTHSLMLVRETSDPGLVRNAGQDAEARFETVVSTINSVAGGSSLFAGVSYDSPALADAHTILDELKSNITAAAATNADDVILQVDAWFANGGGFDTFGYTGGPPASDGVILSGSSTTEPMITAADPNMRELLASFALSALIGRDVLVVSPDEQAELARESGLRLLAALEGVVGLQSRIGTEENKISQTEIELKTSFDSLEIAKSELIGVDPFEAATRLQAAETHLQSLYAMTARLSQLSLTSYLR